jgi:hypothetical protein
MIAALDPADIIANVKLQRNRGNDECGQTGGVKKWLCLTKDVARAEFLGRQLVG